MAALEPDETASRWWWTTARTVCVSRETPSAASAGPIASSWPNRTLILTAAYTGLRASELHALRRRDVDLENGVVHVRRELNSWAPDGTPIFGEPKTRESKRTVDLAAGS
jgi:integrase